MNGAAAAVDAVFGAIAGSIERGTIREDLEGPEAYVGFRRLL